jgi:hypothetical protein
MKGIRINMLYKFLEIGASRAELLGDRESELEAEVWFLVLRMSLTGRGLRRTYLWHWITWPVIFYERVVLITSM